MSYNLRPDTVADKPLEGTNNKHLARRYYNGILAEQEPVIPTPGLWIKQLVKNGKTTCSVWYSEPPNEGYTGKKLYANGAMGDLLGPILEAGKFLRRFISVKVPTPYHTVPRDLRAALPPEIWVNIWAGVWAGVFVSHHYFAVCDPIQEHAQDYCEKAKQAYADALSEGSSRSISYGSGGRGTMCPSTPGTSNRGWKTVPSSSSPPRTGGPDRLPEEEYPGLGVWGNTQDLQQAAALAKTGCGSSQFGIHTLNCLSRLIKCTLCNLIIAKSDWPTHQCWAKQNQSSSADASVINHPRLMLAWTSTHLVMKQICGLISPRCALVRRSAGAVPKLV